MKLTLDERAAVLLPLLEFLAVVASQGNLSKEQLEQAKQFAAWGVKHSDDDESKLKMRLAAIVRLAQAVVDDKVEVAE